MFKNVAFATAGALAWCVASLPTVASAQPAPNPAHNAGPVLRRPMPHGGMPAMHRGPIGPQRFVRPAQGRPPMMQDVRRGGPAMNRPLVRGGRPGMVDHRVVYRNNRPTVINRVIFRDGRRIVVDRPYPVFLGGQPQPAFVGGGAPRGGCSTRRSVSFTPFGWRKIVTVRTCFVR